MFGAESIRKFFTVLFLIALVAYAFFYFTKHDHFLDWTITSSAEQAPFTAYSFVKGPFQLSLVGQKYLLEENFYGSAVQDTDTLIWPLTVLTWIGFAYFLACSTFFSRFTYIIATAGVVLFLNDLDLASLGVLGFESPSKVGTILVIALVVGPSYAFHAFYKDTSLLLRIGAFIGIFSILATFLSLTNDQFLTYVVGASTFGFSILTFIFLFLIAEEIVFGILYLATQTQAKGNHLHFLIFGISYLLIITLYLLQKTGIYPNNFAFADPFLLLIASSGVALWSITHKQNIFSNGFGTDLDIRHVMIPLGVAALSWLSTGFASGNDSQYEAFHYLIIYTHVAFGVIFFLYIIANFIDALLAGHSVYKIVYRERNFPYATARLVGFIAVMGFFFLANYEPYELIRSANFNSQGQLALENEENLLAEQYFIEASIYGYNTHFANYQLAQLAQQKGDFKEAVRRYEISTKRFPTPQAYVNHSAFIAGDNLPKATAILKEAGLLFPDQPEIQNNLANFYIAQSQYLPAQRIFEKNLSTGDWNNAPLVNEWKLNNLKPWDEEEFDKDIPEVRNNAVLSNTIAFYLGSNDFTFKDSLALNKFNLHDLALLNNASYVSGPINPTYYQTGTTSTFDPQIQHNLRVARFFNIYLNGSINESLLILEDLIANAEGVKKGEMQNLKGLVLLREGILQQAIDLFRQSQSNGFTYAQLNEAIALLEAGDFSSSRITWADLISRNKSYNEYIEQLQSIFDQENDPDDFVNVYYRWQEYSTQEMDFFLKKNPNPRLTQDLWQKITSYLIQSWDADAYQKYLALFEPYLDDTILDKAKESLAILKGMTPSQSTSSKNALDVISTISQVRFEAAQDELVGYQSLIEAINIFPDCAKYHEEYALLALKLGLQDYAQNSLNRLEELLNPSDFQAYLKKYRAQQESVETSF